MSSNNLPDPDGDSLAVSGQHHAQGWADMSTSGASVHANRKPRARRVSRPDGLSFLVPFDGRPPTEKASPSSKFEALVNLRASMQNFMTVLLLGFNYSEKRLAQFNLKGIDVSDLRDQIPAEVREMYDPHRRMDWLFQAPSSREFFLQANMKLSQDEVMLSLRDNSDLSITLQALSLILQVNHRIEDKIVVSEQPREDLSFWIEIKALRKQCILLVIQLMKEVIMDIQVAADHDALDESTLQQLRHRQSSLDKTWQAFIKPYTDSEIPLIYRDNKKWWKPLIKHPSQSPNQIPPDRTSTSRGSSPLPSNTPSEPKRTAQSYFHLHLPLPNTPPEPPKIAQAYSHGTQNSTNPTNTSTTTNRANPTLTFLVPTLTLLSFIPAATSWVHSTHTIGTTTDADFYQIFTSSSMAVLGLLTLMIPTVMNTRLAKQAWFWTWVLAGISATCAVVAVPLYVLAPTEWSAAVGFAGSVAQAFVTLQLMYAIE